MGPTQGKNRQELILELPPSSGLHFNYKRHFKKEKNQGTSNSFLNNVAFLPNPIAVVTSRLANIRLAPQFLPSHRPNLPAISHSPEGQSTCLGANLLVTAVYLMIIE